MAILQISAIRGRPWDAAGMGMSVACIAHCVAAPVLAVAIPAVVIAERATHGALAIAILAIGLLAFIPGYRRHRSLQVLIVGGVGFGMLSLGAILPEGVLGEAAETGLTIVGGLTMISAHLRNAYFCKTCIACRGGDEACAAGG